MTSIIFCVALSEYDQVLLEENGQVGGATCFTGHLLTSEPNARIAGPV